MLLHSSLLKNAIRHDQNIWAREEIINPGKAQKCYILFEMQLLIYTMIVRANHQGLV
jgi:hypothetical protein